MNSLSKCPSKNVVAHIFLRQSSIKKIVGGDLSTVVWKNHSFSLSKENSKTKENTIFHSVINQMDNSLQGQACKIDTCYNFNSESLDINPFEKVSTSSS